MMSDTSALSLIMHLKGKNAQITAYPTVQP